MEISFEHVCDVHNTNVMMYLILSIITCIVCGHLVIYGSINAVREQHYYYGRPVQCYPWPGFDYDYDNDYYDECKYGPSGRIAVDVMIVLLAFVQLVLTIVSLGFTCYGTCMCCYSCCRPSPPPAVMQYTAQDGTCQLVSVSGYNAPSGYQPVSLMMVQQAPAGQVVSPSMNVVQAPQAQPVFTPAPANAESTPLTTTDEKQVTSGTGKYQRMV
ncbi:uncharacterized protein [Amphiura filiformis]|uniref:uncharacterized protein n=1 Tax=Amphiura filiformis TaxID=82378 RepID=UPI003B216A38